MSYQVQAIVLVILVSLFIPVRPQTSLLVYVICSKPESKYCHVSSLNVQCCVLELKETSLVSGLSVLVFGEISQLEISVLYQTQMRHTEDCRAFVKGRNLRREALIGKSELGRRGIERPIVEDLTKSPRW
jgi:hypothetical protein